MTIEHPRSSPPYPLSASFFSFGRLLLFPLWLAPPCLTSPCAVLTVFNIKSFEFHVNWRTSRLPIKLCMTLDHLTSMEEKI